MIIVTWSSNVVNVIKPGSLANATPSLKTALEIGREGVQYDAEGAYSTAFDRYEAALQSIIPILNKEPKGRRKDLLHQQVGDPVFFYGKYIESAC